MHEDDIYITYMYKYIYFYKKKGISKQAKTMNGTKQSNKNKNYDSMEEK